MQTAPATGRTRRNSRAPARRSWRAGSWVGGGFSEPRRARPTVHSQRSRARPRPAPPSVVHQACRYDLPTGGVHGQTYRRLGVADPARLATRHDGARRACPTAAARGATKGRCCHERRHRWIRLVFYKPTRAREPDSVGPGVERQRRSAASRTRGGRRRKQHSTGAGWAAGRDPGCGHSVQLRAQDLSVRQILAGSLAGSDRWMGPPAVDPSR